MSQRASRIDQYDKLSIRHAQLLLQSYRERPSSQNGLSLGQYLDMYARNIGDPPQLHYSKNQERQLVTRYCQLKKQLQEVLLQKSDQLQRQKAEVIPAYNCVKELMAEKQLATLEGIDGQLEELGGNDQGEQLARIKKVIANGVWGSLEKLHERLAKLRELQNDSVK